MPERPTVPALCAPGLIVPSMAFATVLKMAGKGGDPDSACCCLSDFSLMDAIECGIVKLPRVPVADNIPCGEMPRFRNLWENIRTQMQ